MQEIIVKSLRKAALDIEALLTESAEEIGKDLEAQAIQADEKPLKFPITVGIKLMPAGQLIRVKTSIAWGRKSKAEAESDVDAQSPLLPGIGEENKK